MASPWVLRDACGKDAGRVARAALYLITSGSVGEMENQPNLI
jgi:hypothetical protein